MVGFLIVTFNYTISVNTSKWNRNFVFFRKTYPQQTNVIKLIFSEGTPWKKEQQKTEKDLPIFPVSGSRIPAKSKSADPFRSFAAPFSMAEYSQS